MRFILIDEIVTLDPGRHIEAVKAISGEEEFFRDHFPGFPVVPGVLLTEMMAQAAGKCLDSENTTRGKAMLAQIRSASFRDWVRPGSVATIRCDIRSSRDTFAIADCRLQVGDRHVSSAELFFSFVPTDRFAPNYRDEVLDRYLATHR